MITWRVWRDDEGWRAGLFAKDGRPASEAGPSCPTPMEALEACDGELLLEVYVDADEDAMTAMAAAGIESEACRPLAEGMSGPYLLPPAALGVLAALGARLEVRRALDAKVPERWAATEDDARRFVEGLGGRAPESVT